MTSKKLIDSCIDDIKTMLRDPNSDLTSEQQQLLKNGIRDLKRLQKAKTLTHEEAFQVVSRIAKVVYEIANNGFRR